MEDRKTTLRCSFKVRVMDAASVTLTLMINMLLINLGAGESGEVPVGDFQDVQPKFLKTPSFYTALVGSTAVLSCAVEDLEDRQVIWRKASDPNPLTVGRESFHNNDRYVVEHHTGQDSWNLVIHSVRLTDSGVYECQVSSRFRHLRQHLLLTVKDNENNTVIFPRPDIQVAGTSYVEKDDRIQLICNVTGLEHPPDDLDWFQNGNKLSMRNNNRVSIRQFVSITTRTIVSILEISQAQLEDSGIYVCRTSKLQIQSMHVIVLNADSNNVKRGTFPGGKHFSKTQQAVTNGHTRQLELFRLHSLLAVVMVTCLTVQMTARKPGRLVSISTVILLAVYCMFPS